VRVPDSQKGETLVFAGIGHAFISKAADLNSTPWELAAVFDFAFPQTQGERPLDAA